MTRTKDVHCTKRVGGHEGLGLEVAGKYRHFSGSSDFMPTGISRRVLRSFNEPPSPFGRLRQHPRSSTLRSAGYRCNGCTPIQILVLRRIARMTLPVKIGRAHV